MFFFFFVSINQIPITYVMKINQSNSDQLKIRYENIENNFWNDRFDFFFYPVLIIDLSSRYG